MKHPRGGVVYSSMPYMITTKTRNLCTRFSSICWRGQNRTTAGGTQKRTGSRCSSKSFGDELKLVCFVHPTMPYVLQQYTIQTSHQFVHPIALTFEEERVENRWRLVSVFLCGYCSTSYRNTERTKDQASGRKRDDNAQNNWIYPRAQEGFTDCKGATLDVHWPIFGGRFIPSCKGQRSCSCFTGRKQTRKDQTRGAKDQRTVVSSVKLPLSNSQSADAHPP